MGLLPSERNQSLGARCENVLKRCCHRGRPGKGRAISGGTKRYSERGERKGSRGQVQFSPARNFRAKRNHVSDRDRDCCDLRVDEEAPLLGRESAFRRRRLYFSGVGFCSLTCECSQSMRLFATPAWRLSMRATATRARFTLGQSTMRNRSVRRRVWWQFEINWQT